MHVLDYFKKNNQRAIKLIHRAGMYCYSRIAYGFVLEVNDNVFKSFSRIFSYVRLVSKFTRLRQVLMGYR